MKRIFKIFACIVFLPVSLICGAFFGMGIQFEEMWEWIKDDSRKSN